MSPMLCYVILEHTRHLAAPEGCDSDLARLFRHKLRFEEISGLPCLMQHYTRVTAEGLRAWNVKAVLISGNVTDWDRYDMTRFSELEHIIRKGEWPILALCGGM